MVKQKKEPESHTDRTTEKIKGIKEREREKKKTGLVERLKYLSTTDLHVFAPPVSPRHAEFGNREGQRDGSPDGFYIQQGFVVCCLLPPVRYNTETVRGMADDQCQQRTLPACSVCYQTHRSSFDLFPKIPFCTQFVC